MKPRFFFWTVGLVAALALFACAPAAPSATAALPTDTLAPIPTDSVSLAEPATLTPISIPVQAVATSRGPNLEATDPTSVNLASGQLQLVEFFRFT